MSDHAKRNYAMGEVQRHFDCGDFHGALKVVDQLLKMDPHDWNAHYLGGMARRCLNDYPGAIESYKRSMECAPENHLPAVWQNLGVAYQLNGNLKEAIDLLRRATIADAFLITAHNSLGLTHRLAGDPQNARKVYENGLDMLARKYIVEMRNSRDGVLFPFTEVMGSVWSRKTLEAALWLAARDGCERMMCPTGDFALEEMRTQVHGGLLWKDSLDQGKKSRLYLPNYFHTMQQMFQAECLYSTLLNNIARTCECEGDVVQAVEYYEEAIEFIPPGSGYQDPILNLQRLLHS